ncbi:MAG: N-acetylmuramoyl-L-alanine amidase [Calditrichaeota bacterium]|nr:N-acetylmuramoyl-L-alanine amidase [Calditrichota bacterium]MCB9368435.1 N-acetylmuramoyl-L-alanine amidase [Calditrichota bacterium]
MTSTRKSGKSCARAAALVALCFLLATQGFAAQTILLTDLAGTPVARLPFMNRGEIRIIPLSMLGKYAGFEFTNEKQRQKVVSPGCITYLEPKNSFGEVNGSFVQLPVPVETWDGSLWLPYDHLDDLFPTTVELSETGDVIRLLGIADSTDGVVKPLEQPKPDTTGWKLGKVIIDPGHGGKDPGCRGLIDMDEKDIALDIARRLESALTANGIPSVMTRRDDKFLTLSGRTRMANAEAGDLFISLHCNSYEDPTIGGAECYILKPARSERAIGVAAAENRVVDLERDSEQYEALTEENYILLSMATSQYLHDSEQWAEIVLNELKNSAQMNTRGIDQAGFYVLMGASMPAILLECGYVTNPDDVRILGSERGRQRVADAVAMSITQMKTEMESAAR